MFERFTESARRLLFFARFEASALGSRAIGTEHLLLGLTRVGKGFGSRILSEAGLTFESLSMLIESRIARGERFPTSVEIPFSEDTKQVLHDAEEEADGLGHSFIGTEHLLLGLLRQTRGIAAAILGERHLRADDVRKKIRETLAGAAAAQGDESPSRATPETDGHDIRYLVQRIHGLVDQLAQIMPIDSPAQHLAEAIHIELDTLEGRIGRGSA